ncbi:MAG: bacillithiol system redox-active protein YtxJ [Balneola sp.]
MGFFKKISNALTSDQTIDSGQDSWSNMTSEDEMEQVLKASNFRPQIIFKHSSSCGISFFAKRSLDTPELLENEEVDLHLIDVIRGRSVSMAFAERMGIRHESPQIFVLKNEKVQWHDSHNSVNAKNVLSNI